MPRQPGGELSAEEIREYVAYGNAGLTLPDKFDGIVIDHTNVTGPVYRYRTTAEEKAAAEAEKAIAEAATDDQKLNERVRAEAAKRGVAAQVAPPPPEKPAG